MLSYLRAYYSMSHNFETFSTPHEGLFLVFGVPNAKYLAFGTPDKNALILLNNLKSLLNMLLNIYCKQKKQHLMFPLIECILIKMMEANSIF